MKIIKQGNPNYEKAFVLTCSHCGCVVEVTKREMSTLTSENRPMNYVSCPTCLNRIYK